MVVAMGATGSSHDIFLKFPLRPLDRSLILTTSIEVEGMALIFCPIFSRVSPNFQVDVNGL